MGLREGILRRFLDLGGRSIQFFSRGRGARYLHAPNRRCFLKLAFAAAAPFVVPDDLSFAKVEGFRSSERSLAFYNLHTGETLRTPYWTKGRYLGGALAEISHLFRDHRTNEVRPIDPELIDLLYAIRTGLETPEPFHIVSGYRCPSTNALLCEQGRGVARSSLHMYGKAADVRLPNRRLSAVRQMAVNLRRGGVGYYPQSEFVHVDVGRVRYW